MSTKLNSSQAVIDFHEARRKADLQVILARITGESNKLLSYEEVRKKLRAVEGSSQKLKDIPLEAIIGSVGRYSDFTRDFLPRHDSDQERWISVMAETIGLSGLPPIEVYQIGEAYFVKDGNHRVSVARQLEATHIQAYVTQVRTRVQLTPDIHPDDLIIKAELANFLEATEIDQLRPEADLSVTVPGQYPILEEHISVHQYFMGIDQETPIPYREAVAHWYDKVYLPVVEVIKERGVLKYFPNRTETDLYLWLANHKDELEKSLGWEIETQDAADDLIFQFGPDFQELASRLAGRILDIVTPDPLETGPPVGHWRETHTEARICEYLFEQILVAVDQDPSQWQALDQGLVIAQKENARVRGLHIVPEAELDQPTYSNALQTEFRDRCQMAGVDGNLALESGTVARQICERARWSDLIVASLFHPPGDAPLERLSSGFRTMIRRCSRPILAVKGPTTQMKKIFLAYSDSPKAQEALFVAAYLTCKWQSELVVLTMIQDGVLAEEIQKPARDYLEEKDLQAAYILYDGPESKSRIILDRADDHKCDLILIGGYKASPIVEVVRGSLVDEILRGASVPVLICR